MIKIFSSDCRIALYEEVINSQRKRKHLQHSRVSILKTDIVMSGHCIAVDPWFIASEFPEMIQLIQTTRKVIWGKQAG